MNPHNDASAQARYEVVRGVQGLSAAALRFIDREGSARGLHRSDLQALHALEEAEGTAMSPSEIARALSLSPSATTTLLDRLERAGHVDRVHAVDDRRRVNVTMTASAGAEARSMFLPLAEAMMEMMVDFSDEEIAVVGRFLEAARRTIDEMGDAAPAAAGG
ncbi:hypothetical protein BHE97_02530 [Aeromicrobium sp. PE09-221]|uniref:MarR family transcriptional regulator n=1 Tax=Aeromicrobium sp. PE09-221 TaxID=1898043 RepID=UPI000B6D4E6E|nr:MarR family transcriptional regulator [Aeromicrobium sp. PE09-221]OUZ12297.1 hypothetical protein BHE97_02530 [Aeromicrobium sp. PE09-221]